MIALICISMGGAGCLQKVVANHYIQVDYVQ